MARARIIYGPTASGKSAYGVQLAQQLGGEVINCDARQVYKGMSIGTGVITEEEMQGVPHHLLQFRDPAASYNVSEFLQDARRVEQDIRARGRVPIYVGGTGLYVQALVEGISEGLAVDTALRAALDARSLEDLVQELQQVDPDSTVDLKNKRYVARALEIFHTTGKPKSALVLPQGRVDYEVLALEWPMAALYERINQRHEAMFRQGLLEEVRALMAREVDAEVWKTIGYPQARAHLLGELALAEAIEQTKTAARHYAKRQMSWLRRMQERLAVTRIPGGV